MEQIKKIETEAGLLGIIELPDSIQVLSKCIQLTEIEENEFTGITSEKRKKEYLAIRILLKELLGFKPDIKYKKSGKPFLVNSSFNISVSHSADLAVVLISNKKIGIDVENVKRNIDKVANRFLSENEKLFIQKCPNPKLYNIIFWSAKEAIFKCTEHEAIQFNKQILIQPFDTGINQFEGELYTGLISVKYKLFNLYYKNNVIVYTVEVDN